MTRLRYKTLVDKFAADIRAGHLSPGTRLPTHRQLASDAGMSLVTATRVYAELEAMGLVSGEAGRGTFVREISLPPNLGIEQYAAADMVDLNFNYPSFSSQTELLRSALRQLATSGELEALLRYQPHGGRQHERVTVAQHLKERGLNVNADNVLIVSGAQHGLATTVMALLKPGDVVAVDALTYPGFKILAETYHLELVAIPAAGEGPDLAALEKRCKQRRIRALYTMPTLHNPLGWVMSEHQRKNLIELARKYGLLIIEDAAYAFLAKNSPPPLAMMAPEITIYVSGFSKNIATGLRVGFIAAPVEKIPALERAIRATTWNTPTVMTAITCEWIADGTISRLEEEKRQDAQMRQLIAKEVFEGMRYVSHPSSYFLWLPLTEEARADQVAMALMREQISVSTSESFATSVHVPHAIRLALGSIELTPLRTALEKVRYIVEMYSCL
ncbi:PLP-dependent aminotransferase family protein [Xenorhabdus bovienii]|uniref:PLP-dependent aminotransferase family protein n=1 Tax=Xenorhabdus bovienii TaxID=40576 RepID=A0AAJ1J5S5_XENBV|nr:PLP-dependent aminotransferase family protein [Xenorhabdus bovienii]MDE1474037.1 PLP-dependent aminotransferase family protein [Xenorhabdus bovienii]MDE1477660.1 PLP-dependent aminotransferase family protein [Xenorhabdus bovienii]MDE1481571.1 PLP-dependent aminotransferase family protein [Xenorhabdus bovienii]MDE1485794.1 PLP-dependent aminotransferase family protein [Xenorhabdus bovienii]MDE9427005.1 PLP-dependent aminotransferase family protein [Xenorhabdus bovienii]